MGIGLNGREFDAQHPLRDCDWSFKRLHKGCRNEKYARMHCFGLSVTIYSNTNRYTLLTSTC